MILCVLTLGGLAWYVMHAEERAQCVGTIKTWLGGARDGVRRIRQNREPLEDVLRARTPVALVTPMLVTVNIAVFAGLLSGTGGPVESALVSWGASAGVHTTNGEWWRLVTSTFIHRDLLHLTVNLAALISAGVVLERLVGHLTFAAVYLAAAVFAGVADLSTSSVMVVSGGSGAIFGLYGLLLASWTWGTFQRAATTIRLRTVKRLAPAAVVFVLYNVADGGIGSTAECAGLVAGFLCGLALARCVSERKPHASRLAATMALAASIAVLSAVPLRGVSDITPELERLVALEERLARTYAVAVDEFRKGRVTADGLAHLIERTVLPELEGPRRRLKAFDKVPPEHQPLLAAAGSYLTLREESWRVRAAALRRSSMRMLRRADDLEKTSLEALRAVRP